MTSRLGATKPLQVRWTLKGSVYGILSAVLVALNAITTKKKLTSVDDNPWALMFYNHVNASVMLIPFVLLR